MMSKEDDWFPQGMQGLGLRVRVQIRHKLLGYVLQGLSLCRGMMHIHTHTHT
jgi:hypothetical protein